MGYATYGLIVTILVMVGIAVFILLFERRRAREIETDASRRRDDPPPPSEQPPSSGI